MSNFGDSLLNLSFYQNKYPQLQPIVKVDFNISFIFIFFLFSFSFFILFFFLKKTKAFEEFQLKTTKLTLESLFVMPVQRLPRYILLLKEMKKYTGQVDQKEEEMLGNAVDKIQTILTDLNQQTPKGNLEGVKRLQMILESVEGELHVTFFFQNYNISFFISLISHF